MKWIPIPSDALKTYAPPYDGKSYDVWFKEPYTMGHRETDIAWLQGCWACGRGGYALPLVYGQRPTHYMLLPIPPDFDDRN